MTKTKAKKQPPQPVPANAGTETPVARQPATKSKAKEIKAVEKKSSLYSDRQKIYSQIEKSRKTKVLAYVTGDRRGMETKISKEVVDIFVDHLDHVGPTKRISLVLYTNGGDTAAAWRLINLLHTFCDELEVIIISKALSAGTLISLGANKIIMTKQAALGPIDPSLDSALNPPVPGAPPHVKAPVSVEAVRGYLDAAKEELNIRDSEGLSKVLIHLADKVHPLVLGQIFRTHSQIRSLAKKLLQRQVTDGKKIEKIIDFLCAESGSHDYTVNRREAMELGLNIEKPSDDFYELLRNLHKLYIEELGLLEPYDPSAILGAETERFYLIPRAIIESNKFGCHAFVSQGKLRKEAMQQGNIVVDSVRDDRTFEGWRKIT